MPFLPPGDLNQDGEILLPWLSIHFTSQHLDPFLTHELRFSFIFRTAPNISPMKKIFILTAVCLSAFAFAQHPTDKGWRSVGGTGNLHFDLDGDDGTYNSFNLAPEVYWFVGNSFALGTDFGFGMSTSKYDNFGDSVTYKTQSLSLWITPGFRFYMRDPEKAWRPYFFGNIGYQLTSSHSSQTYNYNSSLNSEQNPDPTKGLRSYAGTGMAWFFSDHAAFDIRLKVLDIYPGYNSNGDPAAQVGYSPDFMIGVQAFFD